MLTSLLAISLGAILTNNKRHNHTALNAISGCCIWVSNILGKKFRQCFLTTFEFMHLAV